MIHHDTPILDPHWDGYELAADDTHRYVRIYMGSNIRLIAVPHGDTTGYAYGWCYPRDPELVAAAVAAWDADTQDEPRGWHKRPTRPRRAPRRHADPEYNRPLCEHGSPLAAPCRTTVCHDPARQRAEVRADTAADMPADTVPATGGVLRTPVRVGEDTDRTCHPPAGTLSGHPRTPPDRTPHPTGTAYTVRTPADTDTADTGRTADTDTADSGHGVRVEYRARVPRHLALAALAEGLAAVHRATNPDTPEDPQR